VIPLQPDFIEITKLAVGSQIGRGQMAMVIDDGLVGCRTMIELTGRFRFQEEIVVDEWCSH
jgi:hypothetical protein